MLVLEDVQAAMAMQEVRESLDWFLLKAVGGGLDQTGTPYEARELYEEFRSQLGAMLGLECSGCAEGHEEYGEYLAAKLGDELHPDYVLDPMINPLAYPQGGTREGVLANLAALLTELPLPSFDEWVRGEQEAALEALAEQRWER